jgi:hypothetical protein
MKITDIKKKELWKEFKDSDTFYLMRDFHPYDQMEVCFKAGIDKVIEGKGVYLSEEEWDNIKKRLK